MLIEDLPFFAVDAVMTDSSDPRLRGRFSHLRGVTECRSWLYAGYQSLIGDLIELDREHSTAVFEAPFWSDDSPIQVGSTVPWIDGRWQAYHLKMIVDPDAVWKRVRFIPSDAQHFRQGLVHGWSKAGTPLAGDQVPTHIVADGWDHEECVICDTHIGRGGASEGYVDLEDRWLCEACYERYARPRRVDFLLDG